MSWNIETLPINQIFLDQENIRTPINTSDQSALIRDMFDNEDAMQLVRSFTENGVFPDELPIVITEDNYYIVIEGNRRLSALKALETPSLAPVPFQQQIKSLENPKIQEINVVVAPDREKALRHIANKHTVNYKRQWKPLRQAYFYKSQKINGKTIESLITEYPEQDIVRFIKMFEMHHLAKSIPAEDYLKFYVFDERNFPITTFERLYNAESIQELLKFKFDEFGQVRVYAKKKEFLEKLKIIILDIYNKRIDSRKFNSAQQIKAYVDNFPESVGDEEPKNIPADVRTSKKKGENSRDEQPKGKRKSKRSSDFKEQPKPKSKPRSKGSQRSTRQPKTLFREKDVPYRLRSSSLRILYNELKQMEVDECPNAIHDFLRTFLECSLLVFLKETNDFDKIQKNEKHNPSIGEMMTFIIEGKSSRVKDTNLLAALKLEKNKFDSNYSMARLHNINHNETFTSSEKDVRAAWGLLESLFKTILNPE